MTPAYVSSTFDFERVVQLGSTSESLVLEFKATIDGWDTPSKSNESTKRQKEVCRDIAQFANTFGGCILVGVTERFDPRRGVNVADTIVGVSKLDGLRQWIEQAIANYLVPSTFSHDLVPIMVASREVLAANVAASRHLVSLWDRQSHTVEYLRRTSHGKTWMNPDEAERHLMDGSRVAKLALVAAQTAATSDQVHLAGGLWLIYGPSDPELPWSPPRPMKLGELKEHWFEIHIPKTDTVEVLTLPYGVVREAWVSGSGHLTLLLSVRLVIPVRAGKDLGKIRVEPPR